ncbi:hypothetical protein WJU23_04930 [Prosthecobacter sp. SYSU 5D2]|uniref:hypothetical protein n=1 Tax=Prosthecobacter sp. SYSU 5D2 TaxID=3134134 RepID=UPI0031FED238
MSLPVPAYLANHELVLQAFGRWPMFHDAYLLSFALTNGVFECEIHGWNMTREVDEQGYFKCDRNHRVTFRFFGVLEADLSGLEACERVCGTNILFELFFTPTDQCTPGNAFEVRFDSAIGGEFAGWIRASRGVVVSVRPCDAKGNLPGDRDAGAGLDDLK